MSVPLEIRGGVRPSSTGTVQPYRCAVSHHLYIMYREEMLQPSMPGGTCTPQKPPGCGGRGPDPAWMVNAETQTCAPSQIPIWADGQFSCLELLPPQSSEADDSVRSSQQAAWSKVRRACYPCKVVMPTDVVHALLESTSNVVATCLKAKMFSACCFQMQDISA